MDILGIFGFVFAATATGVLVYEHHMDVLSGPYIEGREPARIIAAMLEPMFEPVHALVAPLLERLNWQARSAVYLASLA
jgi:hypothetical protein